MGHISWDQFFMGVAELASKRSKDPNTQCGACIVNPSNHIVSVGYNGLPQGMVDAEQYWKKPDKYEYVVHAEENAILNTNCDLHNCTIYIFTNKGYYPCSKCARDIIQKGIIEVVLPFKIMQDTEQYEWKYTIHMFNCANIRLRYLHEHTKESQCALATGSSHD